MLPWKKQKKKPQQNSNTEIKSKHDILQRKMPELSVELKGTAELNEYIKSLI